MIYITNNTRDEVYMVDPDSGTVMASFAVGRNPGVLVKGEDSRYLYVICQGSSEIVIIDCTYQTIADRIQLTEQPDSAWLDGHGTHLYVTSANSENVYVLDTNTWRVSKAEKPLEKPEESHLNFAFLSYRGTNSESDADTNFESESESESDSSDDSSEESAVYEKELILEEPVTLKTKKKFRPPAMVLPNETALSIGEHLPGFMPPFQSTQASTPPLENFAFPPDLMGPANPPLLPDQSLTPLMSSTGPFRLSEPNMAHLANASLIKKTTMSQRTRRYQGIAHLHEKIAQLGLSTKATLSLRLCLYSSSKEIRKFIKIIQRLASMKIITEQQAQPIIRYAKKLLN